MAIAKSIGWAIYAAGLAIWLFGYLSTGHASVFDWDVATPSWISSFLPNLEAEVGIGAHVREQDKVRPILAQAVTENPQAC